MELSPSAGLRWNPFFYKNLTVIVYFPYHPKSPFYNSNLPCLHQNTTNIINYPIRYLQLIQLPVYAILFQKLLPVAYRAHIYDPLCMTMMQSACWIVDRRCATMIVVLPSMSFSSASCMRISVSVSMLAVASSMTSMLGLWASVLGRTIADALLPRRSHHAP